MTLARSGWAFSLALAVMAGGSPALADDHDAAAGGGQVSPATCPQHLPSQPTTIAR
jgi:hypothetical protein